jgi:prolyl oligopeptidase
MLQSRTLIVIAGVIAGASIALANPPASKVEPVKETLHGVEVVDNYRWLEGDNSNAEQMGKVSEEVSQWTDAQNAYTRGVLDNLPGRKALEERIRPLMQIGSVSAPNMAGTRYFYTKREGTQRQPQVFVRESASGEPRMLLDPVAVDPSGLTALGGLVPSQDGKLLAFGLYRAGDENTTTYVMDVATGVWLSEEIPGKSGVIQWLPDNSGFFYERLADVSNPYSAQIKFHKLGQHHRQDPVLFRQYTKEENEKLATTWGPGATVSRDGRWMVLYYWTGTSSNDIWVVDLATWFNTGEFTKVDIKVGAPNTFFGDVLGDTLYMLTDYNASNKRVIAVDLKNPGEAKWKEIIPENKDAVLTSASLAKDMLVAEYEEKAQSKIRLFAMDGAPKGELALPGIGSAGISVEYDRTEAFTSFTSFNYPTTVFRVDLAAPSAQPVVWERPPVPVNPDIVEVKQVTYKSKDGTPVSMFLVHKKGLEFNGNNPTILNGYGGFNISETPFFSATLFPWFEDGGVFALPNLRGGGEYGKAWHEGGMLANKQNVFDDMIGAAEWLIANKVTNPKKLATTGGSNGGLLMGAMMTQRPELFSAIVCQVPLLDMLRYQNFLMARYWVPEYGDPADADAFAWIKQYSPYHTIKSGVAYPAIFFTAGENDTRVHALHARKMAAAMQAATTSDPKEKPVLLWVDRDAGHGGGKPLDLRIRDAVDSRIFIMWQLGMLPQARGEAGVADDVQVAAAAVPAAMGMVKLHVNGMTCEMCVASVTKTLKNVRGVKSVDVNLKEKLATVTSESGETLDPSKLVHALDGTKYSASLQ